MQALDLSYAAPRVTPAWCAARRDEDVELLVCNLWTGRERIAGTEDALRTAREAGLLTAGYVVVHDGRTAEEHWAQAVVAAGAELPYLRFVAVDVEVEPVSVPTIRAACDLVAGAGLRPCIYTGRWFWRDRLGDPHDLADVPLWAAEYGRPPWQVRLDYGGWSPDSLVGHQHAGTHAMGGLQVDANAFRAPWVLAQPPAAEHALHVVWGWAERLERPPGLRLRREERQAAHELKWAVRHLTGR
jgi:hypothetical protein